VVCKDDGELKHEKLSNEIMIMVLMVYYTMRQE